MNHHSRMKQYHQLFLILMKDVVARTPRSWSGGRFIIHRNDGEIDCEILHPNRDESLEIDDRLRRLCTEYATFRQADDTDSGWLTAVIPYKLGEVPGDFSSEGSFVYPEPTTTVDDSPSQLPDVQFGRSQTANDEWQRSPSLLVIEFILDCGEWQTSTQSQRQASETLSQIRHKFFLSNAEIDLHAHLMDHEHDITQEAVYSAETVRNDAVVHTEFRNQSTEAQRFLEYELVRTNDRWFLAKISHKASHH